MEDKWIIAKASVIGKSHIENDLPCQDAFLCKEVENTDWKIIVVADGAGSCEFSHIGAGKVVELSNEYFSKVVIENNWTSINTLPTKEHWHEIAKEQLKSVYLDLQKFAEEEEYQLKSLSCTIILLILSPLGILCTHIGDGRAGYKNNEGEWFSMITPFRGEFVNETIFITSLPWANKEQLDFFIESDIVFNDFEAFVVLSDGCENICYETTTYNEITEEYETKNKPFSGFLNPISETLLKLDRLGKSDKEIDELWEDYLKDGTEELREEPDDKTLILGIKTHYEKT